METVFWSISVQRPPVPHPQAEFLSASENLKGTGVPLGLTGEKNWQDRSSGNLVGISIGPKSQGGGKKWSPLYTEC